MEPKIDVEVAAYLYKCLLRRRQALNYLKPVYSPTESFHSATDFICGHLSPDEIHDIEKQMGISTAEQIEIYIDGSAKDNNNPDVPNRAAVSFIIRNDDQVIYEKGQYLGSTIDMVIDGESNTFNVTGNIAEYMALIKALEFIMDSGFKGEIKIYSDSELVVNQVNCISRTRSPKLITLRDYARRLISTIQNVTLLYIPREKNQSADALAKTISNEVPG